MSQVPTRVKSALNLYTTPLHEFTFEEDPALFDLIEILYAQNGTIILSKHKEDLEFEGRVGRYYLAQEETALFDPIQAVTIEIRAKTIS